MSLAVSKSTSESHKELDKSCVYAHRGRSNFSGDAVATPGDSSLGRFQ